eukprot:1671891-Rhodomonas_salina.2
MLGGGSGEGGRERGERERDKGARGEGRGERGEGRESGRARGGESGRGSTLTDLTERRDIPHQYRTARNKTRRTVRAQLRPVTAAQAAVPTRPTGPAYAMSVPDLAYFARRQIHTSRSVPPSSAPSVPPASPNECRSVR